MSVCKHTQAGFQLKCGNQANKQKNKVSFPVTQFRTMESGVQSSLPQFLLTIMSLNPHFQSH